MNNEIKELHEYVQDGTKKIREALGQLSKIQDKNTRRIRSELMKAMFDLKDAIEEIYAIESQLKPEDYNLEKEEYVLRKQAQARELEAGGKIDEAAKLYQELLNDPNKQVQMLKESYQAGLYRCSQL